MKLKCILVQTEEELKVCFEIRKKVFIEEQKVTYEEEFDEFDKLNNTKHFLLSLNENLIATCRLRITQDGQKIERVAILKEYRNKGYGKLFMQKVLEYCKLQNNKRVYLYAQENVIPFYEKLGFLAYGESFLDARIPHKAMDLFLE